MVFESPSLGDRYRDFLVHEKIGLLIESLKGQLKRVDPGEVDFYKHRVANEIKWVFGLMQIKLIALPQYILIFMGDNKI